MANPFIAIRDYVMHSIAELKKVTWPSRDMTMRFSALVIVISIAFAGFFAALDFGLQKAVNAVFVSDAPQSVVPDVQPTLTDEEGNPVDVNIEDGGEDQTFQIGDVETAPAEDIALPPLE